MRSSYESWLRAQGYDQATIVAQLHRSGRVEDHYGDLDDHFAADELESVLEALRYSTQDERDGRPNPTPIPINGVLRTNLASYRHAVQLYCTYRQSGDAEENGAPAAEELPRLVDKPTRTGGAKRDLPLEHARTLIEFGFDGQAALRVLLASSRYGSLVQAIASLTVFSHPETVAQTECRALFPCIRGTPGQYTEIAGRQLMLDDNKSPTDAFLWANALGRRGRDTQFNHIYAVSGDADSYTALPNICMTPAFLAKLTDTSPEVRSLLAYRSFDLYGWKPAGYEPPDRPEGYASLEWAAPLPPVPGLREHLDRLMARRPKDRTVGATRRLGWLFGSPSEPISES